MHIQYNARSELNEQPDVVFESSTVNAPEKKHTRLSYKLVLVST